MVHIHTVSFRSWSTYWWHFSGIIKLLLKCFPSLSPMLSTHILVIFLAQLNPPSSTSERTVLIKTLFTYLFYFFCFTHSCLFLPNVYLLEEKESLWNREKETNIWTTPTIYGQKCHLLQAQEVLQLALVHITVSSNRLRNIHTTLHPYQKSLNNVSSNLKRNYNYSMYYLQALVNW